MEETAQKKKLFVKVPSHIVRNEEFNLSNDEFLMYTRLCFRYFRNYHKKEIEVDHKKLMYFLKISDTRTFKKRLKNLYETGLIEEKITNLPTKGNLTIVFNDTVFDEDKHKHFTILSAEVFSYWRNDQIDEYAFRQLFYYKSHINKNDKENDRSFCFVGFGTLAERLKVSKSKIVEANDQLKELKLIKVIKHKLAPTGEYNEDDEAIFDRFNNHYYVADSLH
ncbi:hypothetical protein ACJEBK_19860 [Peribacillus frigoritolerans]|uniref:hypothetical protein n=1 Tax=Peribacillus frigoritolerans TaxID=450367 RepID=UPI0007BF15B5